MLKRSLAFAALVTLFATLLAVQAPAHTLGSCPAPQPLSEETEPGPANTRLQRVEIKAFQMLASARVIADGEGAHTLDRFPLVGGDVLGPRNLCFPIGLHQISGPAVAPGWQETEGLEIGVAGVALRRGHDAGHDLVLALELIARGQLIDLPGREYFAYLRPNNTAPLDHRREELSQIVAHAVEKGAGVCDAWLINTGHLVLVPICAD